MKKLGFRLFFVFFPAVIAIIGALPPAFYQMYNYVGMMYHCGLAPYPITVEQTPKLNVSGERMQKVIRLEP